MIWILVLLGLGVGAMAAGSPGALLGGVLGFLGGRMLRMGDQIKALLEDQERLRSELATLRLRKGEAAVQNSTGVAESEDAEPEAIIAVAREKLRAEAESWTIEEPCVEAAPAARPVEEEVAAAAEDMPLGYKQWGTGSAAHGTGLRSGPVADGWGRSAGAAYRFLTEGNVVAKIGVIVLFFGLAFLLKYAADRNLFPIEARLALVGVGGLVLLGVGWLLRRRHTGYALVLQGGGIGVVYLTLYAAFRLYGLLPATPTFVLMLAVVAGAAALAVLQDARSLAALGIVGGFLAPVLAGTDSGRHTELFTYYLLLDLGILFVAWRKAWRELNLLGFVFTFVIGTAWGVLRYEPALFATTEPFLVGFFLIFLATAVLFAHHRAQAHRDYVQSTLVFGPPLVGFGLQASLVRNFEYGLAYSAFGLGCLYLLSYVLLRKRRGEELKVLSDAFLALGIGFVSLAVPFAFDTQWTSTTWALEGVAMLWIGLRQGRQLPQWFGLLLQFGAGMVFVLDPVHHVGPTPLFNALFLTTGMIGLAGFASAYLLRRKFEGVALLIWGMIWWFGSGLYDLARWPALTQPTGAWLLFVGASLLAANALRLKVRDWTALAFVPFALVSSMWIFWLACMPFACPADDLGWLAWPLAFVLLYGALAWHERRGEEVAQREAVHVGGVWLLTLVAADQIACWAHLGLFGVEPRFGALLIPWQGLVSSYAVPGAWSALVWGLVPAVVLVWIVYARHWPLALQGDHGKAYRGVAALGLSAYLLLWSVLINGPLLSDALSTNWADPLGWGFVPLLNGPDLVTAGAFYALIAYWRRYGSMLPGRLQRDASWWLGTVGFVWLNGFVARVLHAYAGLYYGSMLDSSLAQTTYSIVWAVLGALLVLFASRRHLRSLWLVAAALLGVVVVKLFLVDLSGSNTVERIVSFVGVGLLLLLAGFVAPMPSKSRA
jgi:uncharacterized membrane protein